MHDLPPPAERTPRHTRTITLQGFRRADGLWDIEGELLDVKTYAYLTTEGDTRPVGAPVHNMKIRLTVDADMVVKSIDVAMLATPFPECPGAAPAFQGLVGATLAKGWRKAIKTAAGGIAGCTHLRELLPPMATTAYQTITHDLILEKRARGEGPFPTDKPPASFGTCFAWDFDGPVVKRIAPQFAGYKPPPRT